MKSTMISEHDKQIDYLATQYAKEGFEIFKEPSKEHFPFDLGNYKPDLIVKNKDGSGFILEVKTSTSRASVEKYQLIAQEISSHPGWRFLLVTLEDIDAKIESNSLERLLTWHQINEKLGQAKAIATDSALEPAILYLWSIFEAALRKRAISQKIPIERFPLPKLLNQMYSMGEISVDEFDLCQEYMAKRNRIAHGFNQMVDLAFFNKFFQLVTDLLNQWSAETED
jgi:REase_AHJR-like